MRHLPFSPNDLRLIADSLDDLNRLFIDEETGDYRKGVDILPGRIPLIHPEEIDHVFGFLAFEDGWVGIEIGTTE